MSSHADCCRVASRPYSFGLVVGLALTLVPLATGVGTSASTYQATGRWGTFIGERTYLCRDRTAVWVWDSAKSSHTGSLEPSTTSEVTGTTVSYVASSGKTLDSWRIAGDILTIAVSADCQTAWFIDASAQHIYSIRRSVDPHPLGLISGQALPDGVTTLIVSADGLRSWLQFSNEKPVALAQRTEAGIHISSPANISQTAGENDVQGTYRNERVWIVPGVGKFGLWLSDFERAKPYDGLANVDVQSTYAANEGKLAWVVTTTKGLYLVDYRGPLSINGERNLLPGENVSSVRSGFNMVNAALSGGYAWILTASHKLYCFKTSIAADGAASVEALNHGQPIVGPQFTSPLPIETVIWTGDGSTVWAVSTKGASSHAWASIWSLAVTPSGAISAKPLSAHLYEHKRLKNIYTDLDPQKLWVRTTDLSLYEIDAKRGESTANPFRSLTVNSVQQTDQSTRLWVDTTAGRFLVGDAAEVAPDTVVQLGGQRLSASGGEVTLHQQLNASTVRVRVAVPTPSDTARVALSVYPVEAAQEDQRRLQTVAYGEGAVGKDGSASFPVFIREQLQIGSKYSVEVLYTDARLFDLRLAWTNVGFSGPWYSRPYIRTGWLLIAPIVLLCLATRRSWAVRQWIPVGIPALEMMGSRVWPQIPTMSTPELLAAGAFGVLTPLLAAIWSPTLLRAVSEVQPFRSLMPAVMQLSICRRRFYATYIEDLRRRLARVRSSANREHYVSLPCSALEASAGDAPVAAQLETLAGQICAHDPADRVNVLIEAPGGRGKSALLRELMNRAIDRFATDANAPLPVLGDPTATTIEQMVGAGLGRHRISDDHVGTLMRTGKVALFVDGIGDVRADASVVDRLFASPDMGERTRICVTARPGGPWRESFRRSDRWLAIGPERLDEATVLAFVKEYATHDRSGRAHV